MEGNITVSVILLNGEDDKHDLTYRSLEMQSIGMECMQVLRVNNAEELRQALACASGEYISILESGAELSANAYEEAINVVEDKEACVFPIKSENRSGHVRAMNAFLKKEKEFRNLEISYQFIHSCYYVFFLRRSALALEAAEGELLLPIIWRLIYYVLVDVKELPVAENALCKVDSTGNISRFWNQMKEREISEQFMGEFLRPLYYFLKEKECVCDKHARYVLLYYLDLFERKFRSEDAEYYAQVRDEVTNMVRETGTPELYVRHKNFKRSHKYYFLEQYTDLKFEDESLEEACNLILNPERMPTDIHFVTLDKDRLIISGNARMYTDCPFVIQIQVNGERYDCKKLPKEQQELWFDKTLVYVQYFQAEIPLKEGTIHEIRVICKTDTCEAVKPIYSFRRFAPLDDKLSFSYSSNGWIFTYRKKEDNTGYMCVEPKTISKSIRYMLRTVKSLWKNGKSGKKAIVVRAIYHLLKKRSRKIWLISDRVDRGDDNGEVFFEYLKEQKPADVDAYFVLEKESADYTRISQMGKIIEPFSWKHKLFHLLSEFIISSQGNFAVVNPFERVSRNYKDIMSDDRFVFLQHGVIKDDMSSWLNIYNRNMYGFVVTTRQEYESIFDYNYYYEPERVWLTGLPRYDRLYHDEKNYITVMPTWRKSLAPSTDDRGVWMVSEDFEESDYYQFYNGLLNHEGLIRRAKELGYQICFMPHPNTVSALDRFVKHPAVKFFDRDTSYRKIFAETDLMLTDYSSVAFDFAYLRKPIIYSQFDHDDFFSGSHSYTEGYFDYERDGFGEVEYTLEDSVERIVEYMESGCELKELYRKRIEGTFSFHDQECCKRVLERLIEGR